MFSGTCHKIWKLLYCILLKLRILEAFRRRGVAQFNFPLFFVGANLNYPVEYTGLAGGDQKVADCKQYSPANAASTQAQFVGSIVVVALSNKRRIAEFQITMSGRFHVVICASERNKILIQTDNHLPMITSEHVGEDVDAMCECLKRSIMAEFGLIYLRIEGAEIDSVFTLTLVIFDVDSTSLLRSPEKHNWLPQSVADTVSVSPPSNAVVRYLKEFKEFGLNVNGDRLFPYSCPGWFDMAKSWMNKKLEDLGHDVESLKQKRNGRSSYIICARARSGAKFYMKAFLPRSFNKEVTVSCALAETMPETFSKPLTVDNVRQWMLMSDYGTALEWHECLWETNPELVKRILCAWPEIQKKSIPNIDKLGGLGIPVYDGLRYEQSVHEMLNDPEYIEAQWEGMTEEERIEYGKEGYKKEVMKYVNRLWEKLSEYKVPLTLVHGDLNAVNVIPDGIGNFRFIDFACTSVSVPLVDACYFMIACDGESGDPYFYLELWTEYESMERRRELVTVVEDLGKVELQLMAYCDYKKAQPDTRSSDLSYLSQTWCSKFSRY